MAPLKPLGGSVRADVCRPQDTASSPTARPECVITGKHHSPASSSSVIFCRLEAMFSWFRLCASPTRAPRDFLYPPLGYGTKALCTALTRPRRAFVNGERCSWKTGLVGERRSAMVSPCGECFRRDDAAREHRRSLVPRHRWRARTRRAARTTMFAHSLIAARAPFRRRRRAGRAAPAGHHRRDRQVGGMEHRQAHIARIRNSPGLALPHGVCAARRD